MVYEPKTYSNSIRNLNKPNLGHIIVALFIL